MKRIFVFKTELSKELQNNLDVFNKLILNLRLSSQINKLVVILLYTLPNIFEILIDAINYGRYSLTKEMVIIAIRAHDFKAKMKEGSSGDSLFVRGRS